MWSCHVENVGQMDGEEQEKEYPKVGTEVRSMRGL